MSEGMNERTGVTCLGRTSLAAGPCPGIADGHSGPREDVALQGMGLGRGVACTRGVSPGWRPPLFGDFLESLSLAVEGRLYVSRPPWWGSREQRPGVLLGMSLRCINLHSPEREGPPASSRHLWVPWHRACLWGAQPACPITRSLQPASSDCGEIRLPAASPRRRRRSL